MGLQDSQYKQGQTVHKTATERKTKKETVTQIHSHRDTKKHTDKETTRQKEPQSTRKQVREPYYTNGDSILEIKIRNRILTILIPDTLAI